MLRKHIFPTLLILATFQGSAYSMDTSKTVSLISNSGLQMAKTSAKAAGTLAGATWTVVSFAHAFNCTRQLYYSSKNKEAKGRLFSECMVAAGIGTLSIWATYTLGHSTYHDING